MKENEFVHCSVHVLSQLRLTKTYALYHSDLVSLQHAVLPPPFKSDLNCCSSSVYSLHNHNNINGMCEIREGNLTHLKFCLYENSVKISGLELIYMS